MFALVSAACSDSGPDITSVVQSDSSPVTGQKIFFKVIALTDNPPMNYTWNYDISNSTLLDSDGNVIAPGTMTSNYGAYCITPEEPGTYIVTCAVGDKLDKTDTATFILNVSDRQTVQLMNGSPAKAVNISYDTSSLTTGGIFAAVSGDKDSSGNATNNIKMFTSSLFKVDMSWGGDYSLTAIYPTYYVSTYSAYYVYWSGCMSGSTLEVIYYGSTSSDVSVYTQETSSDDYVKHIILINDDIWVSADSALWYFDTSTSSFSQAVESPSYNADYSGSLSAAATDLGVYYCTTTDMDWEPIPGNQGRAISVAALSSPQSIYALLQDDEASEKRLVQYFKDSGGNWTNETIPLDDGVTIGATSRISKDWTGRIWCGNMRWDGTSWFYPGTQGVITSDIDYAIVSPEGLVYFRTTDDQLWVWGKTPTPYYPE